MFGIAVFCAMCGRFTPVDELAEVIQVQRSVLDLVGAQQSAEADRLRADGAADRIRKSSVKDAATALEVFLSEVFTAKVPNAAQVAGNGRRPDPAAHRRHAPATERRRHPGAVRGCARERLSLPGGTLQLRGT
ncbi:hypothetical protein ABH920_003336 [Catenulispora sp. EB89]|uniref:hypothetical protein n=1 Tax=Catenulispora sp. EB89 TaxID=3156257 RepID=UPI0035171C94